MKFSSLLTIALVAGATSTQASLIPPELQARFLQEHDQLETELDAWKRSPVGQFARESGFFVDDTLLVSVVTQADQLARFFLSKISIEQAQRRNPNAIFSLATPFTLMTKDEFAKFVQRSAIDFGAWGPLHNTTTPLHASRNLQPRPHYHKSTKPPTQPPATTEPATEPPTEAPATTETPTETPVTTAPPTEAPATSAPATRYPVAPKTTEPPATTTSPPATTAAPASSNSKDWTQGNCVSAIKNQGQCGSCWAFSSIATLETAYCLQHGNLTLLSEQELVSCETKDNGCDGGAQVNAFSYIQSNRGVSTEASYPYTSGDSETSGTCNKQGTTKFPLSITAINSVAANDAAFKAATDKQPIAVLVASGNDEWKQYKGGVLSSCSTTEVDHGVVVVGYDDDSFKIRNSWGTWWGDHGYIRLQRISATEAACSLINEWATYPTVA